MEPADRRHVRSVIRRVHPDLFSAYPRERSQNSESLVLLNNYVASLTQGEDIRATRVTFWLIEGTSLSRVDADLPAHGSLGPLFHAFDLISAEELRSGSGTYNFGPSNTDFLDWLRGALRDALKASSQHESLKKIVRGLRASLKGKFGLASIQVGSEFAVSTVEQQLQIKALRTLNACLTALTVDAPQNFDGLSIRLYHPYAAAIGNSSHDGEGHFSSSMQSYVAEDGCLHIVADKHRIHEAVASLDLSRAQLLTRLSLFWMHRVRQLAPALKELLGCVDVWCDSRNEESSQTFVLWAGSILQERDDFERVLAGRKFAFSLLLHTDKDSPLIDFLEASSVLQVRADCRPSQLLDFLAGGSAAAASEAAEEAASNKVAEDKLLEKVQKALRANHVISVCSSLDSSRATRALQRLLDNAEAITGMLDFSGASIAIDDCYELWESGFVSIPYNFELRDLQPQLQKLLQGPAAARQETVVSEDWTAHPDLYIDGGLSEPEWSSDGWKHSTFCSDEVHALEGSASADTAATTTADALARMPAELPFSSSCQSEYSDSPQSAEWPLHMAAVKPRGATAGQAGPISRPVRAFRKYGDLSIHVRGWRSANMWRREARCSTLR